MNFRDRRDAGRQLAAKLTAYAEGRDVIVLALPRGGVPVGYEVARTLHAPLDVFLVRKLGLPHRPELAMGAIATGGVRVINDEVIERANVSPDVIDTVATHELAELNRREKTYRGDRPVPELQGKTVILVDDGLATGSSMRAAAIALRKQKPARIVVAVPLGATETCEDLLRYADEVVCIRKPDPLLAVGLWYDNFAQTSDDEVRDLLEQCRI